MKGERIIVDCSTGKETLVALTVEELAQRELDRETLGAEKIAEDAKIAHDKKINDEMRKMAEDRLIERGELERRDV
jgi:hypothetical protein